jgi:hypothetical protein
MSGKQLLVGRRHNYCRTTWGRNLPTYFLCPANPADDVWETSAFANGVLARARDEEAARIQVAAAELEKARKSALRHAHAHMFWLLPSLTTCVVAPEVTTPRLSELPFVDPQRGWPRVS